MELRRWAEKKCLGGPATARAAFVDKKEDWENWLDPSDSQRDALAQKYVGVALLDLAAAPAFAHRRITRVAWYKGKGGKARIEPQWELFAEVIAKSSRSGSEEFLVAEKGFPPALLEAKTAHNWGGWFDKIRRSPFNAGLALLSDAHLKPYV